MSTTYRFDFIPEQIESWIRDANHSLAQKEDFSWRSVADFMQGLRLSTQRKSQDHLSEALLAAVNKLADEAGEPESGPWTQTFHYTMEQIDHWVQEMADGTLKNQGINWHSLAAFMERSNLHTYTPDSQAGAEWATLFHTFAQPLRRLAKAEDAKYRERESELDSKLGHCKFGECQHETITKTITVHFEACETLWAELQPRLDREGISDLPSEITVKNNAPIGVLPMMLVYAGVIHMHDPQTN